MSRQSLRFMTGTVLAGSLFAMTAPATAQVGMSDEEIMDLPPEYQEIESQTDESDFAWTSESEVMGDGVETIVRTRRIEHRAPTMKSSHYGAGHDYGYATSVPVVEREQWIEECERRTIGRSESEKGGIIGGLLGALFGGFIGNRVAGAGERLAGTLIGAGAGGLGGVLIGSQIGRDKDGRYDCEAALDGYLAHHRAGPTRIAHRVIPMPAHGYGYAGYAAPMPYAPAYHGYGYHYAPPVQMVYVPVHYEQQQRVIVRETVREETYEVPGSSRIIEEREYVPGPRLIKQPERYVPAPSPKMIKQ